MPQPVLNALFKATDQQLERMLGEGVVGVAVDVAGFQDVEKEVFLYF